MTHSEVALWVPRWTFSCVLPPQTIIELSEERDCLRFLPHASAAQSPCGSPGMKRTESRQHLSVELADAKAKIRRLRQELWVPIHTQVLSDAALAHLQPSSDRFFILSNAFYSYCSPGGLFLLIQEDMWTHGTSTTFHLCLSLFVFIMIFWPKFYTLRSLKWWIKGGSLTNLSVLFSNQVFI